MSSVRIHPTVASVLIFLILLVGSMQVRDALEEPHVVEWGPTWEEVARAKRESGPSFDIVLAGDSRVVRGLSPFVMSRVLRGRKILNMGFNGVPLSKEYCEELERHLVPAGARALVFGITPYAFRPLQEVDNGLRNYERLETDRILRMSWVARLLWFVRPVNPYVLRAVLFSGASGLLADQSSPARTGKKALALTGSPASPWPILFEQNWPDGWSATDAVPRDPTRALEYHRKLLAAQPPSPAYLDRFLDRVGYWSEKGIRIVGVRIPPDRRMLELEDRAGGIHWPELIEKFQRKGGVWIGDPSRAAQHTYDGSHLSARSAIRYSHELARAMALVLEAGPPARSR